MNPNHQTLVLNASYEVMKIVSWQRAITWVFSEKVDIIEEYDYFIHSANMKMKIPAVIKYRKHIRPKYRVLKFSRTNIYARDANKCQYCGEWLSSKDLTLDHVLPRSRGGSSSFLNCVACCVRCNTKKADRTPKEAGMNLLQEPRQPNPAEAFALAIKLKATSIPEIWKNYSFPTSK